jgi:hypothetical protein
MLIVMRKLKAVWLKQLSTGDSGRNICYAPEAMEDYTNGTDEHVDGHLLTSFFFIFSMFYIYSSNRM